MKSLSFVLLIALSMPGCMFSKSARMDRAYYKQLKQVKVAREKHRKQIIQHQRAEMPSLRNSPPPLEMQTVQQAPTLAPPTQESQ
ncbi:MAG: hypothetical protein ABR611_14115 [Chthoniobacterales bacterium]